MRGKMKLMMRTVWNGKLNKNNFLSRVPVGPVGPVFDELPDERTYGKLLH